MEYLPPMVPLPRPARAMSARIVRAGNFWAEATPIDKSISGSLANAQAATTEKTMLTGSLERRYARIRKRLSKLVNGMKPITPAEEKRWNRLEAELCDVERRLLTAGPVLAD